MINGVITAQGSAIKAVLGKVAVTASFGAVSKLGIASGVAFDVLEAGPESIRNKFLSCVNELALDRTAFAFPPIAGWRLRVA